MWSLKNAIKEMSVAEYARYLRIQSIIRRIISITLITLLTLFVAIFIVIMPITGFIYRTEKGATYVHNNPHINYNDRVLVSAHRAGGDLAPEETLKAFKLCVESPEYKVDVLEFDLHITKDGELVLLHDDTADRTSNVREVYGANIPVSKLTLKELKSLNFGEKFVAPDGSKPYKGLRGSDIPNDVKILTLTEILDYLTVQSPELNFIIEIKDGGDNGKRAMDKLYQKMVEYDIVERTIIGTFEGEITEYLDERYPQITRSASIVEVLGFYYDFLFDAKKDGYSFDVLQIPTGGNLLFNLRTSAFIDYAHSYDIAVQYWTINNAKEVARLARLGADAIMTDDPQMAYEVVND